MHNSGFTGCIRGHGPGCITLDFRGHGPGCVRNSGQFTGCIRGHGPGCITLDNILAVLEAMALGA